ncbi:hypothetical protein HAHE_10530 [Haloferula helveola]|uniref:Spermidine synthase n=2 Tax=Haloferula helveola TaxID=490095 RepID=A0ABM7RBV9_9BACT|nr:hypothetical protein HAHE_10530 [Haloferula helveola]
MLGRTLLPAFGGSAAVWTVCLAAFQTLLLLGYLYAHLLGRQSTARQMTLHRVTLVVAILWTLGFAILRPNLFPMLGKSGMPRWEVLFCVLLFAGLPYVMLSSGSTLVQAWLARTGSKNVYRLYAVSNLGSFLGLFAYPFVFEPYVSLTAQWWGFSGLIVVYAALLTVMGRRVRLAESLAPSDSVGPEADEAGSASESNAYVDKKVLWLALPSLSVFLLNAVTSYLTLDVIPLPLLWTALLGLFLLSYVIGFSGFGHRLLSLLLWVALGFVGFAGYVVSKGPEPGAFGMQLVSGAGLCLFGCTFLHSWLYAIRPAAGKLSLYYLFNALGGAIGGLIASIVVPLIFTTVAEYPVAIAGLAVVMIWFIASSKKWGHFRWIGAAPALGALGLSLISFLPTEEDRPTIWRDRGFYGTVQVTEVKARASGGDGSVHEFIHGSTLHGIQALIPGRERWPTAYFTPEKMGFGVIAHPKWEKKEPMRVNLVGLGVGVMLAYGREGDYYRCYEISPEVLEIAENPDLFTYVSGCPAEVDLVCEDARKGLERELAEGVEPYDVIVIDAFAGDSLPYHLSTREAFELYFKMLKPDGILALNVTNWHLDLDPFVKAVGVSFKVPTVELASPDDLSRLAFGAKCAFFCRQPQGMGELPFGAQMVDIQKQPDIPMPTDEKGSFVPLIRW